MISPSFIGLMPMFASVIAFSIPLSWLRSQGLMVISRGSGTEREATPDELAGLTSRELEVLRLIAAGHTIAKSARRCT